MLLSCIDYTCIIYVHIESVYSVCHGHFVKKMLIPYFTLLVTKIIHDPSFVYRTMNNEFLSLFLF